MAENGGGRTGKEADSARRRGERGEFSVQSETEQGGSE